MVLRLTTEEFNLLRGALQDSIRSARNDERLHCSGRSTAGIELCRKRLSLEALVDAVEEQRASQARTISPERVATIPLRRTKSPELIPDLVA